MNDLKMLAILKIKQQASGAVLGDRRFRLYSWRRIDGRQLGRRSPENNDACVLLWQPKHRCFRGSDERIDREIATPIVDEFCPITLAD
jgi:hypothetical protein